MRTCCVVLTFESVDEILWCDHSNETSSAVLLHGAICFLIFYKIKILVIFLNFDIWYSWKRKGFLFPFIKLSFGLETACAVQQC